MLTAQTLEKLQHLKLDAMAHAWSEQQQHAEMTSLAFDERFGLLVDAEWLARENKRLARALVSDMIAYLPQKREEGLRDGTLKQIFREEIKKSYEEYVDQIGREIAENTTHFQEALNDLLAGGQKIF